MMEVAIVITLVPLLPIQSSKLALLNMYSYSINSGRAFTPNILNVFDVQVLTFFYFV